MLNKNTKELLSGSIGLHIDSPCQEVSTRGDELPGLLVSPDCGPSSAGSLEKLRLVSKVAASSETFTLTMIPSTTSSELSHPGTIPLTKFEEGKGWLMPFHIQISK